MKLITLFQFVGAGLSLNICFVILGSTGGFRLLHICGIVYRCYPLSQPGSLV